MTENTDSLTQERIAELRQNFPAEWDKGAAAAYGWKNDPNLANQATVDTCRVILNQAFKKGRLRDVAYRGGFLAGAIRYWKDVR